MSHLGGILKPYYGRRPSASSTATCLLRESCLGQLIRAPDFSTACSPAPFVRTFEARKHGTLIVACRYGEQMFLQDPDEDLLAWACDIERDPATLEETRQRWLQHLAGRAQ